MCGIWGILSLKPIRYDLGMLFNKFNQIQSRGPDKSVFINNSNYMIGFHRLAIMDTSIQGDQPFSISYYYYNSKQERILRTIYVCVNGEIYNWKKLRDDPELIQFCKTHNYIYKSDSDCEVILPLFMMTISNNDYKNENIWNYGIKYLLEKLDGEFAFSIYDIFHNLVTDKMKWNLWIGRDRFGIRPCFYSRLDSNTIAFGSEMKSLIGIEPSSKIHMIDPRSWYYWGGEELIQKNKLYWSVGNLPMVKNPDPNDVYRTCRQLLTDSIINRLESNREIGCLLSGGLDSSLIASIASAELNRQGKILRTFSIGMIDSPDVKYAKIVANHIGSIHTNFEIPQSEWIEAIPQVIKIAETFDITSVRATTGQYLICKKIAETTNIKVLLIGDGSDEATGGYLYFHKAPDPLAFHFECQRLLHWIHYFDVLRADRGVASNGIEARVPFLAHDFINFYFQVDPILRIPRIHTLSNGLTNVYEKYLLRKSFDNTNLLPECVLWRKKEAFSDGVSSENKSWYQIIQEQVNSMISDEYFENAKLKYNGFVVPHTKEALYYHEIFDNLYPDQYHTIPYYWLPKWIEGASDPSARTLSIYKDVETNLNDSKKKLIEIEYETYSNDNSDDEYTNNI